MNLEVVQPQTVPPIKLCECGCGLPAPIATNTIHGVRVKGQPQRFINHHSILHGSSRNGAVSKEARAYYEARSRCTNPKRCNWKDYGGRGIKFLFTSFEQFFAELGPRPEGMSLDRIKTDGNYEPSNVRWATRTEQNKNRRRYTIKKGAL